MIHTCWLNSPVLGIYTKETIWKQKNFLLADTPDDVLFMIFFFFFKDKDPNIWNRKFS